MRSDTILFMRSSWHLANDLICMGSRKSFSVSQNQSMDFAFHNTAVLYCVCKIGNSSHICKAFSVHTQSVEGKE
jgi:hypothetical protein